MLTSAQAHSSARTRAGEQQLRLLPGLRGAHLQAHRDLLCKLGRHACARKSHALDSTKTLNKPVEVARAALLGDQVERAFGRDRLLVGTVAGRQRVVDVADRQDAGLQADLRPPRKPIG
jgi:hypothetical protein